MKVGGCQVMEKTAAQKLGLKPGQALMLINPVPGAEAMLGPLPADARITLQDKPDVVLLFARSLAELNAALPGFASLAGPKTRLWLAYAKLTSPLAGDLNRNLIHDLVPHYGLGTVSQIALDQDWSAMRFKALPVPPQ